MLKIILLKLFFIINSFALVYENAEDSSIKRWTLVSSKYKGEIINVLDKTKKSRVIKLDGNGTKSIYQLAIPPTLENIQMDNSFFTWEMNYIEDFVILIVIDTIKGKRHLIYTPDGENSYLQYGLNRKEKGKWQKYSRNLEKDLQLYEKKNKIINIKYFVIKGSGFIDNVHLRRLNNKIAEHSTDKIIKEKIVKKKSKIKVPPVNYKNDILPILNLNGKNPLVIKVGEEYVEVGASARNRDGSKIDISITNNIDILVEGEYAVIYIATNKLGNSSVDKRQVIVGSVSQKKSKENFDKCEEVPNLLKTPKEEFKEEIKEEDSGEIQKEDLIQTKDVERPKRPGL